MATIKISRDRNDEFLCLYHGWLAELPDRTGASAQPPSIAERDGFRVYQAEPLFLDFLYRAGFEPDISQTATQAYADIS
jgi:hypothetical protein